MKEDLHPLAPSWLRKNRGRLAPSWLRKNEKERKMHIEDMMKPPPKKNFFEK